MQISNSKLQEVKGRFKLQALNGKIKWSELFSSDEELILALKSLDKDKLDFCVNNGYVKGTEYLKSFHKQLNEGKTLSAKQVTMLKRLAVEVSTLSQLMDFIY